MSAYRAFMLALILISSVGMAVEIHGKSDAPSLARTPIKTGVVSDDVNTVSWELLENNGDGCIECYLDFRIKLPGLTKIFSREGFKDIFHVEEGNGLDRGGFKLQTTELVERHTLVDITCEKDSPLSCTSDKHVYFENRTKWIDIDITREALKFEPETWYTIRMWGVKKNPGKEQKIDAIPSILGLDLPFDWWNSTYQSRKTITITNRNASQALTSDSTMNLTIDTSDLVAGGMSADCSDLRFVNSTNNELPYEISNSCDKTETEINVRLLGGVPAGEDYNIELYYNATTSVPSAENKYGAWFFYSDKDDASNWNTTAGTVATSNFTGFLAMNMSASSATMRNLPEYTSGAGIYLWRVEFTDARFATDIGLDWVGIDETTDEREFQWGYNSVDSAFTIKGSDTGVSYSTDWYKTHALIYEDDSVTQYLILDNSTDEVLVSLGGQTFLSTPARMENIWMVDQGSPRLASPRIKAMSLTEWVTPDPNYTVSGAEQVPNTLPNVLIMAPANLTYVNSSISVIWNVTGPSASYDCWRTLDSTESALGSISNGTTQMHTYSNLSASTHNLSVRCENENGNDTTTVWFSIAHYNINIEEFNGETYETNDTRFFVSVGIGENVDSIGATFTYNGTESTNTITEASVADREFNFTINQDILLVASNQTNVSFAWNFTVVFDNNTRAQFSADPHTQLILLAYTFKSITAGASDVTEGQPVNFTANYTKSINRATLSLNFTVNNTQYAGTHRIDATLHSDWNATVNVPAIDALNATLTYNATMFVNFSGISKTVGSSSGTLFVYRINLTDCSAGYPVALNFTMFDEDTRLSTNASLDIDLDLWKDGNVHHNASFIFGKAEYHEICIYPANAVYTTNATIQYENETVRNYYLVSATLDNATDTIKLFTILDSVDALTSITVKDENAQNKAGVFVKIQRYYIGSGIFETVAMVQTDTSGSGVTRLRPNDIFYRFIVEDNGQVLQEYDPQVVPYDSVLTDFATIALSLSTGGLADYFNWFGSIGSSCAYNNVTQIHRCTVTDTSGLATKFDYTVQLQASDGTWSPLCADTCTSSSCTFTCPVNATQGSNQTYRYQLSADLTNSQAVLDSGYINFLGVSTYGAIGLFASFLIFLTLAGVGIFDPRATIVMGFAGVIVSWSMGLLTISLASVMGLLVGIAVFVYKEK